MAPLGKHAPTDLDEFFICSKQGLTPALLWKLSGISPCKLRKIPKKIHQKYTEGIFLDLK